MDASPPSLSDLCSSMSSLWLLSLSVELYRLMFGKARPSVTFHQAKRSSFFFDGKLLLPFCPLYTMSFSRLLFGKKSYSSRPAGDRSCSPQPPACGGHLSSCSPLYSFYSAKLCCSGPPCPVPWGQDIHLQRQQPRHKWSVWLVSTFPWTPLGREDSPLTHPWPCTPFYPHYCSWRFETT